MPSDWDGGTITAVFYWTGASLGGSNDVIWALQGRSYADNDAIDQAFGTAQPVTDTLPAADDLAISAATAAITITGAGASELVQFRVYRDADNGSDNYDDDALLIGVMITFGRS